MQRLNSVPDDHKQAFHDEFMAVVAELGKPQEAENAYNRALEKDPYRAISKQFLFQQYFQSNRLDAAIRMLDAPLKNNPSNAAALAERGDLYDAQGKTDLARLNYEQALQIDPNQVVAANNLAFLLEEQGQDLDTALK
jgi:tetratricopeptide (TPR) repeat protein